MQFVANGPDIPNALLQAHEEGRVVFFCGAGISYPAGLPGFKGLVDEIYRIVGTKPDPIEQDAYDRQQYDATLDLLGRRLPGGRFAIRKALCRILKPDLTAPEATATHAALLELASNQHDGALRLITTNFDRVFEELAIRTNKPLPTYSAPFLPIPKNSRWKGLVYLHGLLPLDDDEVALNRLVIASGDFGLAYLTERWAARFVSELFRNYVVCFVGYSINDPVLRYMMDALAADRMLGETTPQAYAMGDCEPDTEERATNEWRAKNVEPILYQRPVDTQDHSLLHQTLKVWAETYRDGILGKERIVVDYAMARPSASTRQDDFVGRMLWALSDKSGFPAKRFAEFDPVPSLEWLEAFSERRYKHGDLIRFEVPPRGKRDEKLGFSFINRPSPYTNAPWMSLVSIRKMDARPDNAMAHIASWLSRHLDDPQLIVWISSNGGRLHDNFKWHLQRKLESIFSLEKNQKTEELDRIRSQAPRAIPRKQMRPIWRLLLSDRIKSPGHELNLYGWMDRLHYEGFSTSLRLELREMLAPMVVIKKSFRYYLDDETPVDDENLNNHIDTELALFNDHVLSFFNDKHEDATWRSVLPELFDDFQALLKDGLDLLSELGKATEKEDPSHWHLPSITPHGQNRDHHDWVALIELVRESWLAIHETDRARSISIAQHWQRIQYPTFKRLALFAASHDGCIDSDQWVGWLSADDAWWLWSIHTHREVMRLMVRQGSQLTPQSRLRLESAILTGPPRQMYRSDLTQDRWEDLLEESIWLHLAKLGECGAPLGEDAARKLGELSIAHPAWELRRNERDEFTSWMSGTGDPDFEESRAIEPAPKKRRELVTWLKDRSQKPRLHEDTWRQVCRKHLPNCGYALCDLAREGIWPRERWREAFQAWSEGNLPVRSWRMFAPLIITMPDDTLMEEIHSVTYWLKNVSKSLDRHEDIFFDLCHRILVANHSPEKNLQEPVTAAINHPIGHIAEALLNRLFAKKPNDGDSLPSEITPLFTQMCDVRDEKFRHGRVLLASRVVALFRIDQAWTETHLLPLFDWKKDLPEARAAWSGFLWSPRLLAPLQIALKNTFLDTANHWVELGESAKQYAAVLTYAALFPVSTYNSHDFHVALGALPEEGLKEAARALLQALKGAAEQREDYWSNRIRPFWMEVWPKSNQFVTKDIAGTLAQLAIAARGKFPEALEMISGWLHPISNTDYIVGLLAETELPEKFPAESLRLLNELVNDDPWQPRELRKCLTAIAEKQPALAQDSRYRKLDEYARRSTG